MGCYYEGIGWTKCGGGGHETWCADCHTAALATAHVDGIREGRYRALMDAMAVCWGPHHVVGHDEATRIRLNIDGLIQKDLRALSVPATTAGDPLSSAGVADPLSSAGATTVREGTTKRKPGCRCHWEEGDSECPVHDAPTTLDAAPLAPQQGGAKAKVCGACKGGKRIAMNVGTRHEHSRPCPRCGGTGETSDAP